MAGDVMARIILGKWEAQEGKMKQVSYFHLRDGPRLRSAGVRPGQVSIGYSQSD